jgi:hypothetical protein
VLGGINPAGLEIGSQLTLVIGNGGNTGGTGEESLPPDEPPPDEPPPVVPIIDPTGDPVTR